MLGKFSAEIHLVNNLRLELKKKGWSIIQLVCSGGQAHFSITYKFEGKNKTVFPDLFAYKDNQIIIGEVKELFDQKDHDKLIELINSELAHLRITNNITIRTKVPQSRLLVNYILINQDINSQKFSKLDQLVFSKDQFELKNGQEYTLLKW